VSYVFEIGKYEATDDQYAEFLNAVARKDQFGLYHPLMGQDPNGGILRSDKDGSYFYLVKKAMGQKPVVFVDWYSATVLRRRPHRVRHGVELKPPTGSEEFLTAPPLTAEMTRITPFMRAS
jgi:hypothetical protein